MGTNIDETSLAMSGTVQRNEDPEILRGDMLLKG